MAPVIIAQNLQKCYAGFSPVLRGANLKVEPGELVAIMGPSGCGKSTMLHIIGMLHSPDAGSLEILGQDVLQFQREEIASFRRNNMGFVMQSSNLFEHSTVFENVEFPLIYERVPPAERWERVIRALELVRLSARVHYRSNRLSGGEQQRVAIARAMVNNPRILLADEPTGALDANTSRLIMENFRNLCHSGGVSMIMVTHDPKMAEFCDSVYTLEDGVLNCQRQTLTVAIKANSNFLGNLELIVRGAIVAGYFPESSGRCLMEEAHHLHATGLLSRIYAVHGTSILGHNRGYALPLPVRHISKWRVLGVFLSLFRQMRHSSGQLWPLWRSIPSPRRGLLSIFRQLWAFGCGTTLMRWCVEENIEFLYASEAGTPATAAWVASHLLKIPFAFAIRANDMTHPGRDWQRKALDATFVRCNTKDAWQKVRQVLSNIDPKRIVLLHDPLTVSASESESETSKSDTLQLLAIGTLCARKGYKTLLEACKILKSHKKQFKLTIAGSGPDKFKLRLLAWRLGLMRYVTFLGQVPHENIADLHLKADIFIAPGLFLRNGESDGLPSALTEAMSFGKAVIVSDLPGQVEVIENGISGISFPQGDAKALANAIENLASSAFTRQNLGQAAKKQISQLLETEDLENTFKSLFCRAIKKK